MDITTLEKANSLNLKIRELNSALNCFEWQRSDNQGNKIGDPISLRPLLIIEYDGDGREQIKLPMNLSNTMVDFLKSEIIKGRDAAVAEFNAL